MTKDNQWSLQVQSISRGFFRLCKTLAMI